MGLNLSLNETVMLVGALSSVALALTVLAPGGRTRLHWSFALGMAGLAVEALAAFALSGTELPEDRLLWLRVLEVSGLLLLAPWGLFVAWLAHPGARLPLAWRVALGVSGAALLAAAAAVAGLPAFQIPDLTGPFRAARLDSIGRLGVVAQLLATTAVLAGLEICLRTSKAASRWRIKYLVLGLGGVFLVRFYLLSHTLLFQVLMDAYPLTAAGTLCLGNLVIGASLARGGLFGVELTVSRQILYRSVVVGVLGCYLFVVGALGWVLTRLGIGEDLFWGSLVVFVSAVGLAAVLLSEDVRWRLKRFIGLHFYRSKYDYRAQWASFTKRLGSLLTLDELAPQLIGAVTETVGATKGVLYLADEHDGRYHLAGAVGVGRPPAVLAEDAPMMGGLRSESAPRLLDHGGDIRSASILRSTFFDGLAGGVVVPLQWRGTLTGLMVVGPERSGARYTPEDLEFLGTVGEQAAGAVVTARLSERLAQTREFDAFHRLTSFVIHDLKNSISALSLLSQNALANFDDPEFQRDAIKTLSRTVDRMKALLARLASTREPAGLRREPVDLAALVREATGPMMRGARVSVVCDLAPIPAVGDPEALLRVIQNLVTNAIEAVEGDGVVTVKTYTEPGWVVVSVADTGCGIPEEFVQKSLFAPFRSTKKGGWGIGLYQTKTVIEAHGGRIDVATKEGQGTTFWVRLPLTARPVEGGQP
jgi:putative PEP-CTERM system histidine kinase